MTGYNLAELLESSASKHPDRTAIIFGDVRPSFAQVHAAAGQVANLLVSQGVRPGDKVALSMPNLPYFTVIYYGILKAGATVVPLNVLLKGREMAYHLKDSETKAYFAFQGTAALPIGDAARAGPARSCSTLSADRPDTCLCVLPLFHAFGQSVVQNAALAFGGTVVMLPRFEAAAALRLTIEERVTFFAGVPTMYWGLLSALDESVDVAALAERLRIAVCGGSALPHEVHRAFEEHFGVTILEGYGLSETSPLVSFAVLGQEPRVGSIGMPIPGVEMKLINDDWSQVKDAPDGIGEIAVKGHNVMKGYYRRPETTAEAIRDDWFRTGDLARKDIDGFYRIVDRAKDMIIRGGFNVYPREIEELLMEHPAVSLAAVIGVPHKSHGEEIKAAVVKRTGDPTSEAELAAWAKGRLASYKYPRIVEFVDVLPMTATGKILKREIS